MTKYSIQDTIEENGIKILKSSLDSNFFLVNDFADVVGKDKYPDIDGQIRLRDGNGTYLNCYLHYQTKSHSSVKNPKSYFLSRHIIDYLIDTNVPTLFFVVNTKESRCFWLYFDRKTRKSLNLYKDKKGRSFDLTKNEINNNSPDLTKIWQSYARSDNYSEIASKLKKVISNFEINIKSCLGILYLFKAVKKERLPLIFTDLLKIKNHEAKTIIDHLLSEEIISTTQNLYLLENEQLGVECLFHLLNSGLLSLKKLDVFLNQEDKKTIFSQLNKIEHPNIKKYFKSLVTELIKYYPQFKNNDDIFASLELLEKYAYKVPPDTIKFLKLIINSKNPLKIVTRNVKGWGKIKGKSHNDILEKSIEILERLRYLKPREVFLLLLRLSLTGDDKVAKQVNETISKIAGYNIFVLRKIGYQPQIFLLDEIEKFGDKKLMKYFDVVLNTLEGIISPSYEGTEWKDYKTMTIHRGGLGANENLRKIRSRAIDILKKLFEKADTIVAKQKILKVFHEATQTPWDNYSKELESIIFENTNEIIKYYISIIPSADHEIIKEIDEQGNWFKKRFKDEIEGYEEMKAVIAQNNDYEMFKIFVGYDYRFAEGLDWKEAEKERNAKIDEFISKISDKSFIDWEKRILSVIDNYNHSQDKGQYQYFNVFLNKLGQEKPLIAEQLIENNEEVLKDFLHHLVAGMWQSKSKEIAKNYMEKWSTDNKYLTICAYVFSYVKEIDKKLIELIFEQAKKQKDVNALNNIVRAISDNYPESAKYISLLLDSIKELTKNDNYSWIHGVWFHKESIMKDIKDKDFKVILENLINAPRIDHEIEEILFTFAENNPVEIINFFKNRVLVKKKTDRDNNYDAIPFNFYKLTEAFQKHEDSVIDEIFKWFDGKDWSLRWEGSHFLKAVFSLSSHLDKKLVELLKTKKKENTDIVLAIVNTYQGRISLSNSVSISLARDFPKYHTDLMIAMSMSGGVVSGEYGFVDSLKGKKDELQKWKKDKRKYIQKFVQKYEEYLDKQIEYEQKRADEDLELRKHDF